VRSQFTSTGSVANRGKQKGRKKKDAEGF